MLTGRGEWPLAVEPGRVLCSHHRGPATEHEPAGPGGGAWCSWAWPWCWAGVGLLLAWGCWVHGENRGIFSLSGLGSGR